MPEDSPVDIVVLWVDDSDAAWCEQKDRYFAEYKKQYKDFSLYEGAKGNGKARYNDFDIIRYCFRSIEKNIPWVRKIFLITNGQKPSWLNEKNERLVIKTHQEFFKDKSHLPTFNSVAIQVNLHNIPELSERFILFDDDMLLRRPLEKHDFFQEKGPMKDLTVYALSKDFLPTLWHYRIFKNVKYIENKLQRGVLSFKLFLRLLISCSPGSVMKSVFRIMKYAVLKREENVFYFSGGGHGPTGYLKSFNQRIEDEFLEETKASSSHKFRMPSHEVNLVFWDQLYILNNRFFPGKAEVECLSMGLDNIASEERVLRKALRSKSCKSITIQDEAPDSTTHAQIQDYKKMIKKVLDEAFPEKSSFER